MENIPEFPELTDLQKQHKPVIDELCEQAQPRASELNFTNLYIWRHAYAARLTRMDEVVCILSLRPDPEDSFLLPPLGEEAGVQHVNRCLEFMAEEGHNARLWRIDQTQIDRLGIDDENFNIEPDRDNFDYVYRVEDLIALEGDTLADKRHHVEAFSRKYDYEYRPITPDIVEGCQWLQELWCDEKHCDLHSTLRAEDRAVNEVLEHLEELEVTGGAILVNDRVQAFSLGESISTDTVVIHIEKASPDLHGAFQVINQQFLEHEWADYTFVNREQDLGEPGLRKAKQSYQPDHMIRKFIVTPRV